MKTCQSGILSLGTSSHVYLEWNLLRGRNGGDLVAAISSLREPRTTIGGVNLVCGFRPEIWNAAAPDDAPSGLHGFNEDVTGTEDLVMPATQHDAVIWLSGSAYDVLFDTAHQIISDLKELACVADETTSWPYHHDRDLTGFIDGTENPSLVDAPEVALIPDGKPGTGGTVLLLQKWIHETARWEALSTAEQELVMGRTKADSIELADKPADSHVASTDQDRFGKIFRRNMPFGSTTHHGTMFVGFSAEQRRLSQMLQSMAGRITGVRDALTRYTRPLTGAYYFVPSADRMRRAGAPKDALPSISTR